MTLSDAISTPEGKQRYVRRLFATIADRYDFITRFLSYGQDRRWKRRLIMLARLEPSDRVLDVACGTGDLVFGTAPHVASAVGMDVTFRMLQLAVRRATAVGSAGRGREPRFVTGDMQVLPFASHTFTVVTTGYGLRNVPDLPRSLREIQRVLAPNGRLLSLDFDRPSNPVVRWAYLWYLTIVGSLLGVVLHGDPDTYRYIPESIRRYPGSQGVAKLLEQLGFSDVRVVSVLGGLMAIHVATAPARDPAPAA